MEERKKEVTKSIEAFGGYWKSVSPMKRKKKNCWSSASYQWFGDLNPSLLLEEELLV